ncbi:tyrosine-type recombinase/integrase, partial [Enterococcus sp. LJL90]
RISTIIFHKSQDFYRKRLKTIAGKAKVKKEKVYPHTVRHFFAKEFIANGGDSTDLQQMLGHESIATTTIYTKLSTNELSEKYREIRNE